jgi:hypothetical protein
MAINADKGREARLLLSGKSNHGSGSVMLWIAIANLDRYQRCYQSFHCLFIRVFDPAADLVEVMVFVASGHIANRKKPVAVIHPPDMPAIARVFNPVIAVYSHRLVSL